jgi:hypothetical protein
MPLALTEVFRSADAFTINTTYDQDLPKTGLLSGLLIEVTGTKVSGATSATEAWRLDDFLTKLEIIGNGSQVIKSINWKDLLYLNYLDFGKMPPTIWRNYASQSDRAVGIVLFGRHPYDTDFGLDLSKWNRVQVKLTNTGSATYYTGNLAINITELWLNDLPSGFGRGYLRTEEFRSWPTVQNKWEYIELPTTNPIRGVHLQLVPDVDASFIAETGMSNLADDVKFGISTPKIFLHDGGVFQRMYLDSIRNPGLELTSGFVYKTADVGFHMGLGYIFGMAGVSGSKDGAVSTVDVTIQGDNNNGTQSLESFEADSPAHLMARGMAVQNFVTLHYAKDADPAWLLDPSRHGQIKLDVHTRDAAAAADGTNRVLLDSLYPHPTSRA